MSMYKHRRPLAGTALVSILLLTAGCSGEADGGGADAGGGQDGVTEISFMTFTTYADEDILPAFEEEYPNIEVDIQYVAPGNSYSQRLQTLAVSDDLPDIVSGNVELLPLMEEGLLIDLTEHLAEPAFDSAEPWGETLTPSVMERMNSKILPELTPNDEQWAVPFGSIAQAVVYNAELFEELGIEPPENWADFTSNSQALQDAGHIPMSLNGELWANWWPQMMWDQTARDVTNRDLLSGEVSFTDPRMVEGAELVQELYQNGTFPRGGVEQGIEESQALFMQGELAQFLTVPENFVQYLVENAPFETGVYTMPGAKDVEPVRTLGGNGPMMGVTAASENKEAAVAFLKYLTSNTAFDEMTDHYVIAPTTDWEPPAEQAGVLEAYGEASAQGYIPIRPLTGNISQEADARVTNELLPQLYLGDISGEEFMSGLRDVYAEEFPDVR